MEILTNLCDLIQLAILLVLSLILILIGAIMVFSIVGFSLFAAWAVVTAFSRMVAKREWCWPPPFSQPCEPDDCRRCGGQWLPTGYWDERRQEGEFTCGCRVVWFRPQA